MLPKDDTMNTQLINKLKNAGFKSIVTLGELAGSVNVLSKVHVRECTDIHYDEISLNNIPSDGKVSIEDISKDEKKAANKSALQKQRLYKGDIVFGYRGGKIGKMGLISFDNDKPLIGNHGMMRLGFNGDLDLANYVFQYLQTPLIQSYIEAILSGSIMPSINKNIISSLPIPSLNNVLGVSKFSLLFSKREKIEEELKALLSICENRKNESLLASTKTVGDVEAELEVDNLLLESLESLKSKVEITMPTKENIFFQTYASMG